MIFRLGVAWHLRSNPWEALDFLTACRVRWICDRYEYTIPGRVHPRERLTRFRDHFFRGSDQR